jgi:transposase-like protein
MRKEYNLEFKLKIVQEHINYHANCSYLSRKYGPSESAIRHWVESYSRYSIDGLASEHIYSHYTYELKLRVVKSYLAGGTSYRKLALENGIDGPATILHWVNKYRAKGAESLKTVGEKNLEKIEKKKAAEKDKEKILIRQLQEENKTLRI